MKKETISEKERCEVPSEWLGYKERALSIEFREQVKCFTAASSDEERLKAMERMLELMGGRVIKQQKIDYHNSWKLKNIGRYLEDFVLKGVFDEKRSERRRVVDAKLIFTHLDLFFNEMERLRLNKSAS